MLFLALNYHYLRSTVEMKNLFYIALLALINDASAQYQLEWSTVLPKQSLNGEAITGMNFLGTQLIASKKDASIWKLLPDGQIDNKIVVADQWINSLHLQKDKIYGIGTELIQLDIDLNIVSRIPIYGHTGGILNNSLFVTHDFAYLLKYDLLGTQSWSVEVGNTEKLLISDNHLYLYSVVYHPTGGSTGYIFKYDTLGNRIWQKDPGMFVQNMVTDEVGNCYVLGYRMTENIVTKLNKYGAVEWTAETPGIGSKNGFVKGDSLFLCGLRPITVPAGEATGDDRLSAYCIISCDDGSMYEYHSFNLFPGDEKPEQFSHIVATDNVVYLAGFYGSQYKAAFIAKFSDPRFVGVKENTEIAEAIKVFPNPAHEELSIRMMNHERSQTIKVRLIDQLGRMIVQQDHQPGEFSSLDLKLKVGDAKGLYLLTVNDGRTTFTEKVIFN